MSAVDAAEDLSRASGQRCAGVGKRAKLTFLGIDGLVENLAAIVTRAGARPIQTVVKDSTVRLMINQEEVAKAFATLVRLVACGAPVTILGRLVPIKAGEEYEGKGCALLSISVRAKQSVEPDPSGDLLTTLRGVIKKHSGSFRLGRRDGEIQFSLYLPVLHGA